MSHEEQIIQENNRLIDIFFTERKEYKPGHLGHERGYPEQYRNYYNCIAIEDLKYYKSWDSLMPVVKKIQKLEITEWEKKKPVINALMDVDIVVLHCAVAAFCKWYNQNKDN